MSKLIRECELTDITQLDILYHSGSDRVEIVAILITREMVRLKMEPGEARKELPYTADRVYHGGRGEYPLREAQHANDKRAHELILAAVREDDASRKIMNRWLTVGPFQFCDSSYRDKFSLGAYLSIAPSYRLCLFLDNWGWILALQRRHRISGHFMTARHYGLNRFLSISRDWKNSASRLA